MWKWPTVELMHLYVPQSRRGFTLLELLTAIAVVTALVALITPAVGRVRDQAKLTVCQAHLHNLDVGLKMYAYEHHSALPVDEMLDNPHKALIDALCTINYVTDAENFYCPSATKPKVRFSESNLAVGNISYFYFSCEKVTSNRQVSKFLRSHVVWPRRLRCDMDPKTWVVSDSWFADEPTAHRFYKRGVNYLTLDGSVHMLARQPRREFR